MAERWHVKDAHPAGECRWYDCNHVLMVELGEDEFVVPEMHAMGRPPRRQLYRLEPIGDGAGRYYIVPVDSPTD